MNSQDKEKKMGRNYSFSRLESFKQCRLLYKCRYIDKKPSDLETIEAFLGSRVHEALKEFYDLVKNGVVKPKEWLFSTYDELWEKNFNESVKIVKSGLSAEDYYRKGKKCLDSYFDEYRPFDRTKTVSTELPISFPVRDEESEYSFYGIIDRLDWNDREKIFEIHDYKTSAALKTQEEADRDEQLALYQLAIRSKWPEAGEKSRLIWHFLLFNKEIVSSRTGGQLAGLEQEVAARIREMETCQDFPPTQSRLCDWCGYQEICPLLAHPKKMEKLDVAAYKSDSGVALVSKYAELEGEKTKLKERIAAIEEEQSLIEKAAIEFAERENVRVIDGPDSRLVITIKEEVGAPTRKEDREKWEKLRETLIRENRYEEVSTVHGMMLNSRLNSWPREFVEKISRFLVRKTVKKVELKKK